MTGINKTDAIAEDRDEGSWVSVSNDSKNEEKMRSTGETRSDSDA
jgi:hypothetical protein